MHLILLPTTELLILDELHKMPQWKNYLKGLYDTKLTHLKIIVTGSARLDVFKKAGDSLAGRYFAHHLLPLSPSELNQLHRPIDLKKLMQRGGFPEPYLAESDASLSKNLYYFAKQYHLPAIQIVYHLPHSHVVNNINIVDAKRFFIGLDL